MRQSQPPAKPRTDQPPVSGRNQTKLRRTIRKASATLISTLACLSIFVAAELHLHRKHGINLSGYRGPSLGRKQPGETRVAVLGGSTTWGFGLKAGQDFPAQLEGLLKQNPDASIKSPITIVNLGWNGDGAYSLKYTMKDYEYLDYDAVVFYSGYNDLSGPNLYVFRHRSPVFEWTGYLPLLPALTVDKLTVWKQKLSGENEKPVFQPPDLTQADVQASPANQVASRGNQAQTDSRSTAPATSQFYSDQVYEAARLAVDQGKRVLIVTEPYISREHVVQQKSLEAMVRARFSNQSQVRYLNLGGLIDLRDKSLCWDGMHLTQEGNRRIAAAMTEPIFDLLRN